MNFKSEIKEIKMDSGEDAVGRWIQVYEKDLLSIFKREVGEELEEFIKDIYAECYLSGGVNVKNLKNNIKEVMINWRYIQAKMEEEL